MNILQVSIARHTRNYEAMVRFYRDNLGMEVKQAWDEPDNRGTLLVIGGNAANTVIELENKAVSGVEPVNVVLSLEVDSVDTWHEELTKRGISIARGLEDAVASFRKIECIQDGFIFSPTFA